MNLLSQVLPGIIVSICSIFITWLVKRTAKKIIETIATRDFVVAALADHKATMMEEITRMFVSSSQQQLTNADMERRVRTLEEYYGVKITLPKSGT